jgi:hypothetical protein
LQFSRYREVWDATDLAIAEIARATDDLRGVSREHGVNFANAATGVDGHYVHLSVMTMACRKMVDVVEKLESVAYTLRNALTEESPPREVQEEMISQNLNDPGWV